MDIVGSNVIKLQTISVIIINHFSPQVGPTLVLNKQRFR